MKVKNIGSTVITIVVKHQHYQFNPNQELSFPDKDQSYVDEAILPYNDLVVTSDNSTERSVLDQSIANAGGGGGSDWLPNENKYASFTASNNGTYTPKPSYNSSNIIVTTPVSDMGNKFKLWNQFGDWDPGVGSVQVTSDLAFTGNGFGRVPNNNTIVLDNSMLFVEFECTGNDWYVTPNYIGSTVKNDVPFTARNFDNNADLPLYKLNSSNQFQLLRNNGDVSVNVETNRLLDYSGNTCMRWDARDLRDINGSTVFTWASRPTISNSHLRSTDQNPPTVATSNTSASVSNATDIAGKISVNLGNGVVAGVMVSLVFNVAYLSAPIVTLTPANAAASLCTYYVVPSLTGFDIVVNNPVDNTTLEWFYQVIETQ